MMMSAVRNGIASKQTYRELLKRWVYRYDASGRCSYVRNLLWTLLCRSDRHHLQMELQFVHLTVTSKVVAGNPTADIYLVSPESAAATAIKGNICNSGRCGWEKMSKELAKVHEPEEYLIDDSMIIKPLPLEEAKEVEIVKGPNIKFLPIPENHSRISVYQSALKGGDNISTDDITPASAEFSSMRSNIPLMSQYCYHRYAPDFAARAKEMGRSVIIGEKTMDKDHQENMQRLIQCILGESCYRKEYCTYP